MGPAVPKRWAKGPCSFFQPGIYREFAQHLFDGHRLRADHRAREEQRRLQSSEKAADSAQIVPETGLMGAGGSGTSVCSSMRAFELPSTRCHRHPGAQRRRTAAMRLAAQHVGAAAHGHEEPAKGAQLPPQKRCPPDDRARVHLPASLAQSCRVAQRVPGLSEAFC